MTQVQVRLSEKVVKEIDRWVVEKGFKSRSDAIRAIIGFYEEPYDFHGLFVIGAGRLCGRRRQHTLKPVFF